MINNLGKAEITPKKAVVGTTNIYTLVYVAGKDGIKKGGKIRVLFPGGHSWSKPQIFQIGHYNGYITVRCSNGQVVLKPSIFSTNVDEYGEKIDNEKFEGKRFSGDWNAVEIEVLNSEIKEGDKVKIVYGDVQGGKGFGTICSHKYIKSKKNLSTFVVQIDKNGSGEFKEINKFPEVKLSAQKTESLEVIAPSVVKAGEKFDVHVKARDIFCNPTCEYSGVLNIKASSKGLMLPAKVVFKKNALGVIKIKNVSALKPGVYWITVTDNKNKIKGESYPIKVMQNNEDSLYWGEMHHHTNVSYDNIGNRMYATPDETCGYARDIANLDFIVITDHHNTHSDLAFELSEKAWKATVETSNRMNKDGKFVVFAGIEYQSRRGHTNVIYLNNNEAYCNNSILEVTELWKLYKGKDVITMPHFHADWGKEETWQWHDEELERLVEVSSCHGRYEFLGNQPRHPKRMKNEFYTVQYQLAQGKKLGIYCGSDDHMGQPGNHHLTAVIAKDKSKKAVFEALRNRHCYGVTHHRIFLDFKLNGHIMGDVISSVSEKTDVRNIEVEVAGSGRILSIALIKNNKEIHVLYNQPHYAKFSFTDKEKEKDTDYYYVRVIQENNEMAWSSPIWVE